MIPHQASIALSAIQDWICDLAIPENSELRNSFQNDVICQFNHDIFKIVVALDTIKDNLNHDPNRISTHSTLVFSPN